MRRTMVVSALVVAACCWAASSAATVALSEGMPPFGLGIEFVGRPHADGTLGLRVIVSGQYDSSAIGETRLLLSPALECVAGDTLLRARVTVDPWAIRTLALRVHGTGSHSVRGVLAITGPNIGRDEAEVEATITVSADTVEIGSCRTVRLEHVGGGQRYRYAGTFLVSIAGPERVTQNEILEAGQRARITQRAAARCPSCTAAVPESMSWVVFVDSNGHVMDARPLYASVRDPAVIRATRSALASSSFTPTRVRGKAVNDWLIVRVPITR